jgi:Family of unknown function (DUF6496)
MALTGASALPLQLEKTDRKKKMPAKDVMRLFHRQKLHSGPDGPVVKDEHQAKAIQMSYARKEGADIPPPPEKKGKSFGSRIGAKK